MEEEITTKELAQTVTGALKEWQKIEGAAVAAMDKLNKSTEHPVIKLVADVIQADSLRHAKVQQLVIDSFEKSAISVSPEDLSSVWDIIEDHAKTELDMVHALGEMLNLMQGRKMVVQQYLLEYLLDDEKKHDRLLDKLALIKKGMYP